VLGGSYALGEAYAWWTQSEQYDVWSVCLNREIDSQRAENRNVKLVLIENHTQNMRPFVMALLWPLALKFGVSGPRMPGVQALTYATYLLGNLRSHPVRQKLTLSAPYQLADTEAIYGGHIPQELFSQSMGFVVMSEVGFSADGSQAFLHVDHVCGLCGHGDDVLLRKVDGKWLIVATAITWIS
jgi:hypothetical protein